MKIIPILALVLCVSGTSVQAGLFDWLFGGHKIECAPADRQCLLTTAFQIEVAEYKDRDVPRNVGHFSRRFADLLIRLPRQDRAALMELIPGQSKWDQDLRKYIQERLHDTEGPKQVTVAELAQVIEDRQAPEGFRYETYITQAFAQLYEGPESAVAVQLHIAEMTRFGTRAPKALTSGHRWIVQNDLAAAQAYHRQNLIPQIGEYSGILVIAEAAAKACRDGDKDRGMALLKLVDKDAAKWSSKYWLTATRLSAKMPGIIHCQGQKAAFEFVDQLALQLEHDLAQVIAADPNPENAAYSRDVMNHNMASRGTDILVRWLVQTGQPQLAEQLFARFPRNGVALGLGEDGLAKLQVYDLTWAGFQDNSAGLEQYSDYVDERLAWFILQYDPLEMACCPDWDPMEALAENLETQLASEIGGKAMQAGMTYLDDMLAARPDYLGNGDIILLELAAVEKATFGCSVTPDAQARLINRMADYKYFNWMTEAAMALVDYNDKAVPDAFGGACLATDHLNRI